MQYQAILFDFDGVLGDTMQDNYRAWSRVLLEYGIDLTHKEYFMLEGLSVEAVAETILARHDRDFSDVATVVALKDKYYLEDNHFRFFPGAAELVAELGERFPLGLVTGGGSERLRYSAGKDFLSQFQVVVTGDAGARSKPAPDPYLLAAQSLNVHPGACLVIENAPVGIQAARSAGMFCVAICSTLAAEYLREADLLVPDLQSLRHLLITSDKLTGIDHAFTQL